jgi:hypothetical protein
MYGGCEEGEREQAAVCLQRGVGEWRAAMRGSEVGAGVSSVKPNCQEC